MPKASARPPGLIAAFEAARAAKKPIVMQKVGRSELGTKAAKSHTASIAGDDAVTEAVMAEFGVVRARNSEEMLDIAHTATRKIYPARNTLGVITVSGGAGVLMSDVADSVGLAMPEMPVATQKRAARRWCRSARRAIRWMPPRRSATT